MNHSTGKPTKAQQARLNALKDIGCIACEKENELPCRWPEIHHLVDKGYRKHSGGHDATIPLCAWHHRGESILGARASEEMYGPSLALSKRAFVERYGSERELLAEVNRRLGL